MIINIINAGPFCSLFFWVDVTGYRNTTIGKEDQCVLLVGSDGDGPEVPDDEVAVTRVNEEIFPDFHGFCDFEGKVTLTTTLPRSWWSRALWNFLRTTSGDNIPSGSNNLVGYYFGINVGTQQYYLGKYDEVDGF